MNESIDACSLTDEELTARRREWRELDRRALLRSEPLPGGRLLVFSGGERTARILTGLIDAERECCPSLGFSLEQHEDQVRLTISFPPETEDDNMPRAMLRLPLPTRTRRAR